MMTMLPLGDVPAATALLAAYADAGATHVVHGARYEDEREFRMRLDALAEAASAARAG
jgi:hypothetical protein